MTATLVPNFSITLNQRRWACVLDPALALSDYGLPLVKQLGELTELWIVRELWHILDNPQFYLRQPELILGQSAIARSPQQQQALSQQVVRALKEWDRLRTMTDRTTWNIRFLADVMGESCLPTGIDPDLLRRWESLAQGLSNSKFKKLGGISRGRLDIREHEVKQMLPRLKPEILGQSQDILKEALARPSLPTNLLIGQVYQMQDGVKEKRQQIERE